MTKPVTLPSSMEHHRILNLNQTAEIIGYSVAHLRRLYRTGQIPMPIKIGQRKYGYRAATVLDLIEASSKRSAA
jgi:predicted DNA-binding transcriptional regulator AlpA